MTMILIGPTGAGKGTQAYRLAPKFDLLHFSSGDLFRENLEKQTALGILAKKYIDQGELVPDEVVDAMVEEYMRKADPGKCILFDGFPRTTYQARFLEELFKDVGRNLEAVIYLKVSDEEVLERLQGRVICRDCQVPFHQIHNPFKTCPYNKCHGEHLYQRDDDTPEITSAQLRIFHRRTARLVNYYQKRGKLVIIDGENQIDQVYNAIVEAIEAVRRQEAPTATREEAAQIQALKTVSEALSPDQASHRSLDIVLLGGPGSGKGTQAERLSNQLELRHVATGDLFRENLKNETELGKLAKSYMDRGELVPDNVTEAMVRERLSRADTSGGFILDGFPRTLPQAEALTDILTNMNRRLDGVLYIKVSDEEIVKRLSGRLICRECQTPFHNIYNPFKTCPFSKCNGEHLYQRDDDNPETVRARLKTFHRQTAPLVDYYRKAGLLFEVAGEGPVSAVTERTTATIQKITENFIR